MSDMWRGERVRLRAVESADWEHFQAFAESTIDVRNSDVVDPPWSTENFRSWTTERAGREPSGDSYRLVIETLAGGEFAGSVAVGECDNRAGRFKLGVEIAPAHRRKGYAAEATRLVLTYMFAERRHNKCEVEIYDFNAASLALFRSLGFTEEGRLREHEYFAGTHHDVILFGITAPEHWTTHPHPPLHLPPPSRR